MWSSRTQTQTDGRDRWAKSNNFWMNEDCDGRLQEMRWGRCKTGRRRTTNGLVQYNAGSMDVGRSHHNSHGYPQKIITIQGTKQTSGEDVVLRTNTRDHTVIHFTAKQTRQKEYAGCAIMIPTEDSNFIHTIAFSNDPELRGRVGYVRLMQQNRMDITVMTVYIPVEGTNHELTGEIWDWIEEISNKLEGASQIYRHGCKRAHAR